MKNNILKAACERDDDWGQQVSIRVGTVCDLVAAAAIYHDLCCVKFFSKKSGTGEKRGRPSEDYVIAAMEDIYTFLDQAIDCQYSMDEVMRAITGEKPTVKTVKEKLQEKYKERLIISQLHSHKTVLCFKEVGNKILNSAWYESSMRGKTAEEERLRVVRAAAAIIKEDIQSRAYDTSQYPPSEDFLGEVEEMIPPTLLTFFQTLLTSRYQNKEKNEKNPCLSPMLS